MVSGGCRWVRDVEPAPRPLHFAADGAGASARAGLDRADNLFCGVVAAFYGCSLGAVLPDGVPTAAVPNNKGETGSDLNAVSSDGSRVFFTARANEGIDAAENEVFVRENANATIEVSASKAIPAVRDARARFQAASKDGSQVFFTGSYGLTTTSSTGATTCSSATGAGCDLYRYDVNTGALTDISADVHAVETGDTTGADVLGVLGISEEGADVYFSASGQLVPGKSSTQATNTADRQANVYVYHGGLLSYVASIGAPEAGASAGLETTLDAIAGPHGLKFMVSRVSPDGTYLLFATSTPITQSDGVTYDNIDEITGKPDPEEYEYSLATGSVTCVSCEPGGRQPVTWEGVIEHGLLFGAHGPYIPVYEGSVPRNLSDKGQVFFDSFTPLVKQAKNGTVNAYEWEPEGVGTCPTGRAAGCVSLLDSGTDPNGSYFEGASADGASAYVSTYAQLAYPDADGLRDIYVVREDGGVPVPIAPPPCTGEGCQGALAPGLSVSTPGSASGSGGGNLPSPPSPPPARAGKAAVEGFTARAVHGYTVDVSVSAPSRGRISASGAGLTGVKRSVAKAGVYKLKLSLTAAERRALTRKKKLKLEIRVGFVPSAGAASSSTFAVTFIRQ